MEFKNLTLQELKDYCKKNNIKNYSNKKKLEIIELIKSNIPNEEKIQNKLKFIDLFCGIGGFHQALLSIDNNSNKFENNSNKFENNSNKFENNSNKFENNSNKFECNFACDIDKKCREVYKLNYQIEPFDDVKKIDEKVLTDFDILTAGMPCQSYSNAGKKLGLKDNRGLLFNDIIRIARYKKPKFIFIENVKHLLKISDGKVIEYIKDELKSIGYHPQVFVLSPHQYGIPQHRERIYIVSVRDDLYNGKDIILEKTISPIKTYIDSSVKRNLNKYSISDELKNVFDAWDELIKQFEVGEILSPTILIHDVYRNYTDEEYQRLPKWKKDYISKNKRLIEKYKDIIDEWYKKYKELLSKREIYGKLEWQSGKLKKNDSIYNYFIQVRQSGIRVKKTDYFPTLVAISQIPIYAKEKRYITPRECARLQSFPDDFILDENDKVSYKQLGNSVNVYITKIVIESTLKHYGLI
jgi:DNA (cytosine-5)-methyltransferase 1